MNNEHPLLPSPCLLLLFALLCIGCVPLLVVVMFVQGGARLNEEEDYPHSPPLLGFMFQNENETRNMKMKHKDKTQNTKHETLKITSLLVCLFALCAFLIPLVLFYWARKKNE
jgi:hypothetical protein